MNSFKTISFDELKSLIDFQSLPGHIDENRFSRLGLFEENASFDELDLDEYCKHNDWDGLIFLKDVAVKNCLIQEEMEFGPLWISVGKVSAKNIFLSGGDFFFLNDVSAEQTLWAGDYNHGSIDARKIIKAELIYTSDHLFNFQKEAIRCPVVVGVSTYYEKPPFAVFEETSAIAASFFDEKIIDREKVIAAIKKGKAITKKQVLSAMEKKLLAAEKSQFKKKLDNLGLDCFPVELFQHHSWNFIDLSNNKLKNIPVEVAAFAQLEQLNLDGNGFENFPEEILSIPSMSDFGFGHNRISSLPDDFILLKNLKKLSLRECDFNSFPKQIYELPQLELLDVSGQQGERSQIKIECDLPCLKHLNANYNRGFQLLAALPKLEAIELKNCGLTEIPAVLFESASLKRIDITGCNGKFSLQNEMAQLKIWKN